MSNSKENTGGASVLSVLTSSATANPQNAPSALANTSSSASGSAASNVASASAATTTFVIASSASASTTAAVAVASSTNTSSSSSSSSSPSTPSTPSLSMKSPFELNRALLHDYVRRHGGSHVISKILIANNGIAAVKCMRSIRKFCYETFGNDRMVEFVAMATPEDLKANAQFIHLADEFVRVPGGTNNNNYANIMLIAEIAERVGADAVWAGWGHASENPKLPEELSKTKNKCIWIGPPPAAMRALGDKIGSTLIAQSAGVPCIPWSGSGLTVDYSRDGLPKQIYGNACVTSAKQSAEVANRIGFPVMIKASEGGGGKGIRRVEKSEDVELAFNQVQGEVPGSPIFIMKLAHDSRHLEVQLLADEHGGAIAVCGRDCSIQRRHQKIIEEGPVVAAPASTWKHMEQSAVRLAKEVGYVGVGTVEYLYAVATGEYYFLELNPRLQVEHPVTELNTGVNLPAAQWQVAMGIPLHRIRGVRRLFGQSIDGDSEIDFDNIDKSLLPGHVIAVRVTAENPDAEFQPTSGGIVELNFRSTPDVWGYFSVGPRGGVHEFSDSQFGHMFSSGATRELARKNMVLALKELSIRGDIRTTVEFLRNLLETEDFKANRVTTTWLEKVMARRAVMAEKPEAHLAVILGSLYRASTIYTAKHSELISLLENSQYPPNADLFRALTHFPLELIYEKTKYILKISKSGPTNYDIVVNQWRASAELEKLADDGLLVLLDGKKYVVYGQMFPSGLRLVVDGKTCVFTQEYDPTQLRASMQGKLVRYLVPDGAHVNKNGPFAEVEVMKMFLTLSAPESGLIRLLKPEGSIIEAGDLLATLVLDNPDKVQKAEVFSGTFPVMREPRMKSDTPSYVFTESLHKLRQLLAGYYFPKALAQQILDDLMHTLRNPLLPLHQFREVLSTLTGRIPETLHDEFVEIANEYEKTVRHHRFYWEVHDSFPVVEVQSAIDRERLIPKDDTARAKMENFLTPVVKLLQDYKDGNHSYAIAILSSLINDFVAVEEWFNSDARPDHVIKLLRANQKYDVAKISAIVIAHYSLQSRSATIIDILNVIEQQFGPLISEFSAGFKALTSLVHPTYATVALMARQLTMRQQLPSAQQRKIAMSTILTSALAAPSADQRRERLGPLIDQSEPIEDLIFSFFETKKHAMQHVAMEALVRRVHQAYEVHDIQISHVGGDLLIGKWQFSSPEEPTAATPANLLPPNHVRLDSSSTNLLATPPPTSRGVDSSTTAIASSTLTAPQAATYFLTKASSTVHVSQLAESAAANAAAAASSAVLQSPNRSSSLQLAAPRRGVMVYLKDFESVQKHISMVLNEFDLESATTANANSNPSDEPQHVLYIAFKWGLRLPADEQLSSIFRAFVRAHESALSERAIRRVTFVITLGKDEYPAYFTYRHRLSYEEDTLIRHIEPSYAVHMQLHRMSNYDIRYVPTTNRLVHLFAAYPAALGAGNGRALPALEKRSEERKAESKKEGGEAAEGERPASYDGRRFFVRSIIRVLDSRHTYSGISSYEDLDLDAHPEPELAFVEALNELEVAVAGELRSWRNNHIFINVLVQGVSDVSYVEAVIRQLAKRYADKIRRLNVSVVEFSMALKYSEKDAPHHLRYVCTSPTGYMLLVDIYEETRDALTGKIVYRQLPGRPNSTESFSWEGQDVSFPYPQQMALQKQRLAAEGLDTTYCYDFIPLIEFGIQRMWAQRFRKQRPRAQSVDREVVTLRSKKEELEAQDEEKQKQKPTVFLDSTELILVAVKSSAPIEGATGIVGNHQGLEYALVKSKRPRGGQNNIGMVAFFLRMYTPEYANGRDVILIANDITFMTGTFGPLEDLLFDLASKYARTLQIPRLYYAANSGARIDLAEELRGKFKIAWQQDDLNKGLAYLYLSESDYSEMKDSVKAAPVKVDGLNGAETRYVITDIIGRRDGLGVENLRGSGMIAGETSQAYQEIFTLTYVTGRTVGIGAYLARLGQRCIQKETPPIILTGFNALNKLLGKQVYTSNVQLGGPEIMYTNGVTHMVVRNDFEGVTATLKWLSYVPAARHLPAPLLRSVIYPDPVDRTVEFRPSKQAYDVRCLFDGVSDGSGNWTSGFFDRNSFTEVLGGWARGVVAGRARLGGLPMGVIGVETRTIEQLIPADPATAESKEYLRVMAGGVWFPDSAYKTAQAIWDLAAEDLPLMIFANWRGFSGGMRDMLNEVLKFGSYIVDALRAVHQPIFVYLPPHGTLRGGAWVVVDPTINPQYMEMYSDEKASGGVLETEGTLDVRFRRKEVLALAHRLDAQLIALDKELKHAQEAEQAKKNHVAASVASSSGTNKGKEETEKNDHDWVPVEKKDGEKFDAKAESPLLRSVSAIASEIQARENRLFALYHQAAGLFVDLHDTPGRMYAKGCIAAVVPWADSRKFFYWRLRRRQVELDAIKRMQTSDENTYAKPSNGWRLALNTLYSFIPDIDKSILQDNAAFVKWFEQNSALIQQRLNSLHANALSKKLEAMLVDYAQSKAAGTQTSSSASTSAFAAGGAEHDSLVVSSVVDLLSSLQNRLPDSQRTLLQKALTASFAKK